jgi:ABC-type polysaccharide/polyol phosphate export permease
VNIGLLDLIDGLKKINIAYLYAWGDTKARYRRSFLGPLWIVVTTVLSVAGLGYVWSMLFNLNPSELVPSLTIGLVIWQLVSACILESPTIFVRYMSFIKNVQVPYTMFPLYLIIRQFIYFFHAFIVVIAVLLIYNFNFNINFLLFLPNCFLLFLNLFWIVLLFSCIGIRYRDFEQIVSALMPMLFFLSPVIYRPSQLKFSDMIVWLNPFSYMIELLRNPLLGLSPPTFVYLVAIIFAVFGNVVSIYYFSRIKRQIPFLA